MKTQDVQTQDTRLEGGNGRAGAGSGLGSCVSSPVMGELWTLEDLERLWKPRGITAKARRKWVIRRVHGWGIPMQGKDPRFLPAIVLKATEKELGKWW